MRTPAPAFPRCGPVTALLRVSRDTQDVASQRETISRWCNAYGLGEPVWIEEPDNTSGAAVRRPALDHILAAARRGRIRTFLATEISRVGRLTGRTLETLDALDKAGARLVFPLQGLDFSTDVGRLVAGILASVAEYERRLLIARTKAGMEVARKAGRRPGRAAFVLTPGDVSALSTLRASLTWAQIAAAGFELTDTAGKRKRAGATALRLAWKRASLEAGAGSSVVPLHAR